MHTTCAQPCNIPLCTCTPPAHCHVSFPCVQTHFLHTCHVSPPCLHVHHLSTSMYHTPVYMCTPSNQVKFLSKWFVWIPQNEIVTLIYYSKVGMEYIIFCLALNWLYHNTTDTFVVIENFKEFPVFVPCMLYNRDEIFHFVKRTGLHHYGFYVKNPNIQ